MKVKIVLSYFSEPVIFPHYFLSLSFLLFNQGAHFLMFCLEDHNCWIENYIWLWWWWKRHTPMIHTPLNSYSFHLILHSIVFFCAGRFTDWVSHRLWWWCHSCGKQFMYCWNLFIKLMDTLSLPYTSYWVKLICLSWFYAVLCEVFQKAPLLKGRRFSYAKDN